MFEGPYISNFLIQERYDKVNISNYIYRITTFYIIEMEKW